MKFFLPSIKTNIMLLIGLFITQEILAHGGEGEGNQTIYGIPYFVASLDSAQTVPQSEDRGNTGSGRLWLVDNNTKLKFSIRVNEGLDIDGFETNGDTSDDLTAIHLHNAAVGVKGPHSLNVFKAPCEDDKDLIILPFNRTVNGIWDDGDVTDVANCPGLIDNPGPQSESFSSVLQALCNEGLYINVHTEFNPDDGEIRGQILATARGNQACESLGF